MGCALHWGWNMIMTAKRLLCAGGLCLLLSGMRDPFQPPRDTCLTGQLASWRFHGVVAGSKASAFYAMTAGDGAGSSRERRCQQGGALLPSTNMAYE
ncbi:hypothetical protein CWS02_02200 [Enterobacter sp. EA-1]|nr:hypothetical protein CWS02_02200 [Enterobacter sp. EA-1]